MFVNRDLVICHKRFLMNVNDKKGFNMNELAKYTHEFRLTPVFTNCPKFTSPNMTTNMRDYSEAA